MDDLPFGKHDTYKLVRDDTKQIITDQGNVEALELVDLTDKIQIEHYHQYVIAAHVYCTCGRLLKYENLDPEIQSQVKRLGFKRYDLLTTPVFSK